MDRIDRALKKLSQSEKAAVQKILLSIKGRNLKGLDIKKLKGYKDIFRARQGKIRIIFRTDKENNLMILAIERRSETTYRNF
jgi:mRNA-degrading endonuclease RelE of RelBE toxin-antitoxin system